MSDLVYSIENIFSINKRDGALGQNNAIKYLIAPYQRGYKWSSDNPNAPVWLLMSDIKNAYNVKASEYFLQYITVKKNIQNELEVLEVIDGQQRLTTLTLMFSVLDYKLDVKVESIVKDKLAYKIRENVENFFSDYIYSNVDKLLNTTWKEFINNKPKYNEQDIFYLFEAVHCINRELKDVNELKEFYKYLRNNVQIIFNIIEKGNISSEKVFSNLNSNKVELTSVELVKGILLTRVAREKDETHEALHFKEILEIRAMMGRQWDEMCNWLQRSSVKSFYLNGYNDSMEGLLTLVAYQYGYKGNSKKDDKYSLFNFFQKEISQKSRGAHELFSCLKETYSIIKGWYENVEIHKYLGYLFFNKSATLKLLDLGEYLKLSKIELKKELASRVVRNMPDNIEELEYGENDNEIHQILLALSVFGSDSYFDFEKFSSENWSLEHIFPQNPKKLSSRLLRKDIELIKSLLKKDWKNKILLSGKNDERDLNKLILSLDNKLSKKECILVEDEKSLIYNCIRTKELNSLGNMALLTKTDNSSNGNGMFDTKRLNIVNRISEGSFVPKHTYDMFSKLIDRKMTSDLTVWTENDIKIHAKWIVRRITEIKNKLQ